MLMSQIQSDLLENKLAAPDRTEVEAEFTV